MLDRVVLVALVLSMGCSGGSSASGLDEACARLVEATEGAPSAELRFEAEANADPEARAEIEAYYARVTEAILRYLADLEDLAPEGRDAEWREALHAVRELQDSSIASRLARADEGTTEILNEYGVGDCVLSATRPG